MSKYTHLNYDNDSDDDDDLLSSPLISRTSPPKKSLSDKFAYLPSSIKSYSKINTSSPIKEKGNDPSKTTISNNNKTSSSDQELLQLRNEFPDIIVTLIKAVYANAGYSIDLARSRLKALGRTRTTRLSTLGNSDDKYGVNEKNFVKHRLNRPPYQIMHHDSDDKKNSSVLSSKKSSKVELNKNNKLSIYERYALDRNNVSSTSSLSRRRVDLSKIYQKEKKKMGIPDFEDISDDSDDNILKLIPANQRKKKKKRLIRKDELDKKKKIRIVNYDDDDDEREEEEEAKFTDDEEEIRAKRRKRRFKEEDNFEMDDDINDEEYGDNSSNIKEERTADNILSFLNTADERELAEIANIHINQARKIVEQRPFNDLEKFKKMDFPVSCNTTTTRGKKSRNTTKHDGEKFLDRASQTIQGYDAIESLISTCNVYGTTISKEIKKWGVDINVNKNSAKITMDSSKTAEVTDNNDDVIGLDFTVVNKQVTTSTNSDGSESKHFELKDNDEKQKIVADVIDLEESEEGEEGEEGEENESEKTEKDLGDEYDEDEDDDDYNEEGEEEEYDEDDDDYFANKQHIKNNKRRNKMRDFTVRKKHTSIEFYNQNPKLLNRSVQLKDYQISGINWLYLLYQNNMSCILADEMGLGKTCQVISFLAYLSQNSYNGPHLIVVPSSTLENWLREFEKFCPKLRVRPYYGSLVEREELREVLADTNQYDVLVTTYNLASGNKYDQKFLTSRNFDVVVYDEGHMLKNSMSERFMKLMKLKAHFRLLLTGTPLQNNLRELMSLLEFIMPQLFVSKKDVLSTVFKHKTTTKDAGYNPLLAQKAIDKAKIMMKPFILRRRKEQVLKHLPPKNMHLVYCEMTHSQQLVYSKIVGAISETNNNITNSSNNNKKINNVINKKDNNNYIMELRKAAIHPLLFRHLYSDKIIDVMSDLILDEPQYRVDGNKQYIEEDMSVMDDWELNQLCENFPKTLGCHRLKNREWMDSGKIEELTRLLKNIIEEKHEKVLIFSLFTEVLSILEAVLTTLNYKFLRLDGSTQVNDRQLLIDKFYEDNSIPIFLLSTKAGGFGINLVVANNVIIFDQSFNPHDDKQAADRAHRVGQTKVVNVYTLISRNTIEEKIYQLAENKLALDSSMSGNNTSVALTTKIIDGVNKNTNEKDEIENKIDNILENIISKGEINDGNNNG
ncbi:related to ATP-dependent helicase FUN30 [Saccharomycodes ludwigii]|uniref:DNA helicase n=1 Tax=Saccharomycodes ludwigii TaxID=36035 RepID=A0A376BAF3_9ASCO|nr:hypothetical protein SCDLUD_000482 [Saccharomycodes ludwigii]KAH3902887.1 hypothetical protein SCDLUD_000482 [Saccharomycodes ludwigii]SSD61665.1 related to ATP-dependent helicase FUN30 [Saccharomycodes ludwigii]